MRGLAFALTLVLSGCAAGEDWDAYVDRRQAEIIGFQQDIIEEQNDKLRHLEWRCP